MEKFVKNTQIALVTLIALGALFFTGCGKYQAAGTATGAAIGAKVGKGNGALVGALIGNYVGTKLDKSEEREEHRMEVARLEDKKGGLRREVAKLEDEKEGLRRELSQKWCCKCNKQVDIKCAKSCPACGVKLVQEKFCHRCKTIFNPETGYRYCPYCSVKVALHSR